MLGTIVTVAVDVIALGSWWLLKRTFYLFYGYNYNYSNRETKEMLKRIEYLESKLM